MSYLVKLTLRADGEINAESQAALLKAISTALPGSKVEYMTVGISTAVGEEPIVYKIHKRAPYSANVSLCETKCHPSRITNDNSKVTCKLCSKIIEDEG